MKGTIVAERLILMIIGIIIVLIVLVFFIYSHEIFTKVGGNQIVVTGFLLPIGMKKKGMSTIVQIIISVVSITVIFLIGLAIFGGIEYQKIASDILYNIKKSTIDLIIPG